MERPGSIDVGGFYSDWSRVHWQAEQRKLSGESRENSIMPGGSRHVRFGPPMSLCLAKSPPRSRLRLHTFRPRGRAEPIMHFLDERCDDFGWLSESSPGRLSQSSMYRAPPAIATTPLDARLDLNSPNCGSRRDRTGCRRALRSGPAVASIRALAR